VDTNIDVLKGGMMKIEEVKELRECPPSLINKNPIMSATLAFIISIPLQFHLS
jgi:hypothetical protein